MKIILSPAKKMNMDLDTLEPVSDVVFLEQAEEILQYLQNKSYAELKDIWKCNDKIAALNYKRLNDMDLRKNLTPAILSYEGIAYQYMAPAVFESGQLNYVQDHLRMISAFYGVLKPLDGVVPYRLEMQAKAAVGGCKNLYEFWGRSLYDEIHDEDGLIINLASKEYSRCMERYLTSRDTYITCVFGELVNGKMVQKGTYAKMARGEMVRFMAEHQIKDPQEIKQFNRLGYVFQDDLSTETEYVFRKLVKC